MNVEPPCMVRRDTKVTKRELFCSLRSLRELFLSLMSYIEKVLMQFIMYGMKFATTLLKAHFKISANSTLQAEKKMRIICLEFVC